MDTGRYRAARAIVEKYTELELDQCLNTGAAIIDAAGTFNEQVLTELRRVGFGTYVIPVPRGQIVVVCEAS